MKSLSRLVSELRIQLFPVAPAIRNLENKGRRCQEKIVLRGGIKADSYINAEIR
jgi:hypothetical protein